MKKRLHAILLLVLLFVGIPAAVITLRTAPAVAQEHVYSYERQHLDLMREQTRYLERIASSLEKIERKTK